MRGQERNYVFAGKKGGLNKKFKPFFSKNVSSGRRVEQSDA